MIVVREVEVGEGDLWRDIRLRTLADSPDAFTQTLDDVATWTDAAWRAQVDNTARHPDYVLFVAEADAEPIGTTFSSIRPDGAGIGAMWVDPSWRGQGIGRMLLDRAVEWARARGCATVFLSVVQGNGAARALYESCGFQPTGETRPLRDGSHLIAEKMARDLTLD